jgi:elongation factor Ts
MPMLALLMAVMSASSATAFSIFSHQPPATRASTRLFMGNVVDITPKNIKALRDMTGAGMMDCKKALTEAGGDMDAASESLRMKGLAKADKKAARVAAEGRMVMASDASAAVLVEINCETDFVAKDATFQAYCQTVANTALQLVTGTDADISVETLMNTKSTDSELSLEEDRQALVAKIGENIQVRRLTNMKAADDSSTIGAYVHMNRIGVLVLLSGEGGTDAAATDVAMHVTALNPPYATADEVPASVIDAEKAFLVEQASSSGKPPEIVEKMVTGRIRKYLQEICCDSQPFVKNPDVTVAQMLGKKCKLVKFQRLEVGEGLAKKQDDFAAEVAAMAGSQ